MRSSHGAPQRQSAHARKCPPSHRAASPRLSAYPQPVPYPSSQSQIPTCVRLCTEPRSSSSWSARLRRTSSRARPLASFGDVSGNCTRRSVTASGFAGNVPKGTMVGWVTTSLKSRRSRPRSGSSACAPNGPETSACSRLCGFCQINGLTYELSVVTDYPSTARGSTSCFRGAGPVPSPNRLAAEANPTRGTRSLAKQVGVLPGAPMSPTADWLLPRRSPLLGTEKFLPSALVVSIFRADLVLAEDRPTRPESRCLGRVYRGGLQPLRYGSIAAERCTHNVGELN